MMVRFLLILIAFHLSLASHALTISADILNSELKKNYSFVERSLNQSDLKIETSSGKILFDPLGVTVKVLAPFEENYRIEGDRIEIHDVFLDQKGFIWQNKFFYDYSTSNGNFQVFSELNTEYNFGEEEEESFANDSLRISPGIFLSYFPNQNITLLALVQHSSLFAISNLQTNGC